MPTGIGPDESDTARLAAVQALLDAGAEVDAQNGDGYAALHLAALALKPKLVGVLLAAGARVDLSTGQGKSALQCAGQFEDMSEHASSLHHILIKHTSSLHHNCVCTGSA